MLEKPTTWDPVANAKFYWSQYDKCVECGALPSMSCRERIGAKRYMMKRAHYAREKISND